METKFSVKVISGASRNEISGLIGGVWKLKIAASPEKGKANKELVEFLGDKLGIRRDGISILKGQTSHNKLIAIRGLTLEEINKRLSSNK